MAQGADASHEVIEEISIDSPHQYSNNYNRQWIIDRPGATKMQVYFDLIDTENGWDKVYVKDANGNIKNTWSGYHVGATSVWVTGTRIRVQLVTDGSITDWGFFCSELAVEYANNIESPHNYPNNYDHSWWVENKYASKICIKFERIDVETNYDYVRLYDYKNNLKWTFTGSAYGKYSPYITGHKVKIRLTSDSSITKYGFKVESVLTLVDDDARFEISVLAVEDYRAQPDLNCADADSCALRFTWAGWNIHQNERDAAVDRDDFYDDGDEGDLIYFAGHGTEGRACLDGYNQWWRYARKDRFFDHNDADDNGMGEDDWEWTCFAACDVLGDSFSHCSEFIEDEGHACFGCDDEWADGNVANNILLDFYDYLTRGWEIEWAWSQAAHDNNQFDVVSIMHDKNDDDHLWGYGTVYPDPTSNGDISWWEYD